MTDRYNAATYFELIVKPTYEEYQAAPFNFRKVFLAAMVMAPTPEYIPHETIEDAKAAKAKAYDLRDQWTDTNTSFKHLCLFANAAKHGRRSGTSEPAFPSEYRPPARAGHAVVGRSVTGDRSGRFWIEINGDKIDVHEMMRDAYAFISKKIQEHGGPVNYHSHTEWDPNRKHDGSGDPASSN
ncbi:hypothetical protein [Roseibium alexandrii]|uniref:Uncharacterized protein n=1 Tax=Roseibium alexandrii TaxID=388408 RepID=A0A0M6ZXZ9_9HYPH|nr:hypothetical protein [Roseibium alexandrii]CTQ67167.1 hypothetical protein LAX5112_01244 [Roseibium alexandrii]